VAKLANTFQLANSVTVQVVANRASGPGNRGDDLYAFVGYATDGDPVHHCAAVGNWGRHGAARGISSVGGEFTSAYVSAK